MSATVSHQALTGSGPTKTDITSINTRANAENAHTTAGTSNLIRSRGIDQLLFWVVVRLDVAVAPTTASTT
jgi:hypothetical protein